MYIDIRESDTIFRLKNTAMDLKSLAKKHHVLINRLVRKCMSEHVISEDQKEDMNHYALIGLWEANKHFDPDKGEFITYASKYIELTILKHAVKEFPGFHIPNRIKTKIREIKEFESKTTLEKGHDPQIEEISEIIGISAKEISDLKEIVLHSKYLSLSASDGTDEKNNYSDTVIYDDVPYRKPDINNGDLNIDLNRIQESWTEEEKRIYALRFNEGLSRKKIAEIMKCSVEKVTRIEEEKIKEIENKVVDFRKRFL